MKLLPTLLIGWLVLGFVQDAAAFDCATFDPTRSRYQPVVLNSATPCTAAQSTIMSATEYTQFLQMQADIAALQANGGGAVATVFDPILAGQIWMFAITMILGSFLLAKNAGLILEAIKRW